MREWVQRSVFTVLWLLNALYAAKWWYSIGMGAIEGPGSYGFSEFLINYQGGIVRRGMFGELLYRIVRCTEINPSYIVVPLCVICFLLVCWAMFLVVKRLRISWLALPTFYVLFGSDFIRKDFLIWCVLLLSIFLYRRIAYRHLRVMAATLGILIALNLHEASCFYAVPMYFLILFSDKEKGIFFVEKLLHCGLVMSMMLLLCATKGSLEIATRVSESWQFIYPNDFAQLGRNSISALGWELGGTLKGHFVMNFIRGDIPYSGFILRPLALLIIFYLMVRVTLCRQWNSDREMVEKFIFISSVHFVSLLPMLTVLSCDFRRVVSYWTISSLFSLYFLRRSEIFGMKLPLCRTAVGGVYRLLEALPSRKWALLLLIVFSVPYEENALVSYCAPLWAKCINLLIQ